MIKMRLQFYWNVTKNKRLNNLVGGCLILSFLIKVFITIRHGVLGDENINSFGYSEFLINFQGGLVRRGLVGETLYQLCSWLHIAPLPLITAICYSVFLFVLVFFIYKFYKRNYCWWILLSPLLLNNACAIIRKDYILYALLIGCLYVLKSIRQSVGKRYFACIIVVFGVFIHEAFIFWGFPIYALIIISQRKDNMKFFNYIIVMIPLFAFCILSLYKGSIDIRNSIINSWNQILPDSPLDYSVNNSINALGWDVGDTFIFHLKRNLDVLNGGCGIVLLPIYALIGYYLFTNFLSLFSKVVDDKIITGKLAISLLYSMSIICLIPMFTVLSCDVGRNFQYASVVTFATFIILPGDMIINAFPKWYVYSIMRFNDKLDRFFSPSKGLLIIILLFIGMSLYMFSLQTCWDQSVIGTIWNIVWRAINKVFVCLLH